MCQVNIGLNFQVHDSNKEITGVANIEGQVTPLHIAVMRSDRDATEALLRCGADVNGLCQATISTTGQFDAKINVRGEVKIQGDLSPLHLATLRGAEPVIQQLLRYKPDLGLMCHAQLDLQCAVSTGMSIQADIKVQFKANALHLAILLGREDMVRQYLAAGMKPSSDGEGTLVYLAQVLRRQSIAQLLAQNGG
jgi:ankyrin repeat protein